MSFEIRQATVEDLELLVPLFDGYRQFYGQVSDLTLARVFLFDRFIHRQSAIFLAFDGQQRAVGFTQLFPSFSSVSAARIFILNDLFVSPEARGKGVGKTLLRAAADFGRATQVVRLELTTAETNLAAQTLYEQEGWHRSGGFLTYERPLNGPKHE